MKVSMRIESDSVGSMQVPAEAYYGVQTLRGYENFRITGNVMNWDFTKNIVKIGGIGTGVFAKEVTEIYISNL